MRALVVTVLVAALLMTTSCAREMTAYEQWKRQRHEYVLPMPKEKFFSGDVKVDGPKNIIETERDALEGMGRFPDAPQVPFGYMQEEWELFKKTKIKPGDELFEFVTLSETGSYAARHGASGIAIVRDGIVVEVFATSIY